VTLPLRARLAVFSALVCGLLLSVLSVVSYGVLGRLLNADVTMRLMELTDGLHGYLRFETELPTVEHNNADSAQAAFVQEATRYMRIYDVGSGRLLLQSDGFAPMGLHLTPEQVRANRAHLQPFDVPTGTDASASRTARFAIGVDASISCRSACRSTRWTTR
jgi:hypothetical protein